MATALTPMFNLVTIALRRPGLDGEATWTLSGGGMTQWSLAIVRPEEERPCDLRWTRCGVGSRVKDENVGVGPEDLVVVYIRRNAILQMDKSVYRIVLNKFVGESWLKVGLSERQNLVEVFPGDARVSKGPSTRSRHLTAWIILTKH